MNTPQLAVVAAAVVVLSLLSLAEAGRPSKVLIATEVKTSNYLYKYITDWSVVEFTSVTNLFSSLDDSTASEVAAVMVDGNLYSTFSADLNAVLEQQIPLIITNINEEQKDILIEELTFGIDGASYIYGVLPFVDGNNITHRRVIYVPQNDVDYVSMSHIDEFGATTSQINTPSVSVDFEQSARMFSEELFASVINGVYDPPANMTPPKGALYAIIPTTIVGSYVINLTDLHKPGSQTFSHRLDNVYYNYRENGFGQDGYYTILMQDGIVSPGSLVVNNPSQAIGYYQYEFAINNQPLPLGSLPKSAYYYWASSSPATVDQTVSITDSVSEAVSIEIDMTVDGPSSKISVTWTASTSTTSEIQQWGVVEDTNPATSATAWTYHQQLPYDPYNLQWNNFPTWWSIAYDGNNVRGVPDLSTNTLQVHTISAWYAAGALRSNNTLPVVTNSVRVHGGALIGEPDYYNGHHIADISDYQASSSFKMDLNNFPNA